jgi:hypothetical protein
MSSGIVATQKGRSPPLRLTDQGARMSVPELEQLAREIAEIRP